MHQSLTFDLVENIWPWPLMYRQIYIYHSDIYVWRLKHYNSLCYRWHYRHSERIDVYKKLILVVFTNIWNYHIVCIRKQTKAIMYECQRYSFQMLKTGSTQRPDWVPVSKGYNSQLSPSTSIDSEAPTLSRHIEKHNMTTFVLIWVWNLHWPPSVCIDRTKLMKTRTSSSANLTLSLPKDSSCLASPDSGHFDSCRLSQKGNCGNTDIAF